MLITACTDCGARFRVTPEQLNLHQGAVKCGSCGHVFNGFETLEQIPDEQFANFRESVSDAGMPENRGDESAPPNRKPIRADPDALDHDLPELESVEAMTSARPAGNALESEDAEPVPARNREEARRSVPRERSSSGAPALPHEMPAAAPRRRPGRVWGFGALLLFVTLACLALYEYRADIATRYPDLRPSLQAACERLGCSVPWQNDEMAVKLEDSELLEVPGQPGQITLSTRIRNLSEHPQEFPLLQLTLTDIDGLASVKRVFAPAEYLGRPLKPGEAMSARGDTLVSLRLEARRVKATGYELLLFYP